jgi:autotransporter-associated beta strand protein
MRWFTHAPRPAARDGRFFPQFEALETRLLPSLTPLNTFYWTGAARDGQWSNAANWASPSHRAPVNVANAVVILDYGRVRQVHGTYQTYIANNLPGGTTLLTLAIQGTAQAGEGSFQIAGNRLSLRGGMTDTANNGTDSVQAPIHLLGNVSVSVSGPDPLVLGGRITEGLAGLGITKQGGGSLFLTGSTANTASGTTTVAAGNLYLDGTRGVRQVTPSLVIDTGAAVHDITGGQLGSARVTMNFGSSLIVSSAVADTIGSLLGGGAVSLGAGSVLTVRGTPGLGFGGSISGAGGLILAGGPATLSGASSYTGGTEVASGLLKVAGATALGSGGVRVDPAAVLALEDGISSAAQALRLAGTLEVGSGQGTWNGPITLTGDAQVSAGPSAALTLTGTITGRHTLTVAGGGTVVVTGHDKATNTTVQGATLEVNGSAGAVTVGALGVLEGRGTTGAVTVNAAGTLEPGFTQVPGAATTHEGHLTTGAVTFAQGSVFLVWLDFAQLDARGDVDLTGATLIVAVDAGPKSIPGEGEGAIIQTAPGASITGKFADVTSAEYAVTYRLNTVTVNV